MSLIRHEKKKGQIANVGVILTVGDANTKVEARKMENMRNT